MAKIPKSRVVAGHADFEILDQISKGIRSTIDVELADAVASLTVSAFEFVLDPISTGRTSIIDLDNVEKTFVGLKVEHFIRDIFDAPKGLRDLIICGIDVDVKHTLSRSWSWMIPPETIRDEGACLLIASSEYQRKSWMGLIMARPSYLGRPNRDGKCSILSSSYHDILWLVEGVSWPKDKWSGLDMMRFRELRKSNGSGAQRASDFFRENIGRAIHRDVACALLHDQKDPMKRLRGNKGAKDILRPEGIALMSGTYYNGVLKRLNLPTIGADEFIAVRPNNIQELEILKNAGELS
jgi:hypothetical protein